MEKIKSFDEFVNKVEKDPNLQEKLKQNPLDTLREFSFSGPIYTSDKLVYRLVVGGFMGVLFFGILYFIYQYQRSIEIRTEYSKQILDIIKNISSTDSLSESKITSLKSSIVAPTGINGTTPDGIIAVFTAIIGALAGLFAPSPFSKKNR